jgi:acyl-coenzyme A thioesterase PaaI-like protein
MPAIDLKALSKTMLATLYLRGFGLSKIPLLFFLRPSVVAWSEERVVIKIPLRRRSKNHLGSMYFAALAAGADLAIGFLAMEKIRRSGHKVSLIFKNMQADFLKRAEGDVHFICEDGVLVTALVDKAVETGERVELAVPCLAVCPALGPDPVARFTLTLSLKRKTKEQSEVKTAAQGNA